MMKQDIQNQGITLIGLGPGEPGLLTRQAWDWMENISEIYLRTRLHPTVPALPEHLVIHSFDEIYAQSNQFEDVYREIIRQVLELGKRPEGVTYAVPGHPYVAETTCPAIVQQARELGIPVRVLEGLSFLEPTFTALGVDPYGDMVLVDALELGMHNCPLFPPSAPALIAQIYNRQTASNVKLTLAAVYPDEYPVQLVHGAGTADQIVETLKLYEIDRSPYIGLLTSLYVPPMAKETSFEAFQELVAHLRAPDGCPWDREQTHQSLRTSLLEETYEVLQSLDEEDPEGMCEEFGDLLLQIVLHAQIAAEEGEFTMADVLEHIHKKIVFRHPHVFGDLAVNGTGDVLTNWEKLKEAERKSNGQKNRNGLLDGVPKNFPALAQAQAYQSRAARVNFDWDTIQGVLEKVHEEMSEVSDAQNDDERAAELGDLLFAVVNLVRWYGVDAESALRESNQRFRNRFAYVEHRVKEMGKKMGDMSQKEMDIFWEEAKRQQK